MAMLVVAPDDPRLLERLALMPYSAIITPDTIAIIDDATNDFALARPIAGIPGVAGWAGPVCPTPTAWLRLGLAIAQEAFRRHGDGIWRTNVRKNHLPMQRFATRNAGATKSGTFNADSDNYDFLLSTMITKLTAVVGP